jgi:hypothetical protein
VTRDRLMTEFCARFPEYCFRQHKGYGTELHLLKLHEHGPCPIHRRSFEPVAQPLLALEFVSKRVRRNAESVTLPAVESSKCETPNSKEISSSNNQNRSITSSVEA